MTSFATHECSRPSPQLRQAHCWVAYRFTFFCRRMAWGIINWEIKCEISPMSFHEAHYFAPNSMDIERWQFFLPVWACNCQRLYENPVCLAVGWDAVPVGSSSSFQTCGAVSQRYWRPLYNNRLTSSQISSKTGQAVIVRPTLSIFFWRKMRQSGQLVTHGLFWKKTSTVKGRTNGPNSKPCLA